MVQIGKTLGNRMVDLQPTNEKLRIRSRRILRELAGVDDAQARDILAQCEGRLKPALVVALASVEPDAARSLLDAHGGQVRLVLKSLSLAITSPGSQAEASDPGSDNQGNRNTR
jgi:N-acetylmuramic acid 6-phosphate etherase